MKCYMLWHGGSSYAHGYIDDDLEEFDSIKEAAWAFERRAWNSETYYPCVEDIPAEDGGPSAWIFLYDPRVEGTGDPYPDRVMEFGPRGGVRIERC